MTLLVALSARGARGNPESVRYFARVVQLDSAVRYFARVDEMRWDEHEPECQALFRVDIQ